MEDSARVIGPGCGPTKASVMFVGEAPGRLGADGSHLPFHGDKAGHNFEALLEQVGLSRYDVFVTNAVLCNPRDERGNNATPTLSEIRNCSDHLRERLRLVDPAIVVTLGATALQATANISAHTLSLRKDVRTSVRWADRMLVPLYHPGQRAMIHRSFANQLADYQFVVEKVRRLKSRKRLVISKPRPSSAKVAAVAERILKSERRLSYFALHKLLFLAEAKSFEETGERLTSSYIIRQKDGPYCVELHPGRIGPLIPGAIIYRESAELFIELPPEQSLLRGERGNVLVEAELRVIDDVLRRYAKMSKAELKRVSYLATPMRRILRRERLMKANLFNAPLFPS